MVARGVRARRAAEAVDAKRRGSRSWQQVTAATGETSGPNKRAAPQTSMPRRDDEEENETRTKRKVHPGLIEADNEEVEVVDETLKARERATTATRPAGGVRSWVTSRRIAESRRSTRRGRRAKRQIRKPKTRRRTRTGSARSAENRATRRINAGARRT